MFPEGSSDCAGWPPGGPDPRLRQGAHHVGIRQRPQRFGRLHPKRVELSWPGRPGVDRRHGDRWHVVRHGEPEQWPGSVPGPLSQAVVGA